MDDPALHPWSIGPGTGPLVLDGDWKFPLTAASETPWQVYVYSVKGAPNLLKVGIAKDAKKRKELYYGELLWVTTLPRRTAGLVEYLFKHCSYRFACSVPPQFNVGNWDPEALRPAVRDFSEQWEAGGKSEVRELSLDEAVELLTSIAAELEAQPLCSVIRRYGIKTFTGAGAIGRDVFTVAEHVAW